MQGEEGSPGLLIGADKTELGRMTALSSLLPTACSDFLLKETEMARLVLAAFRLTKLACLQSPSPGSIQARTIRARVAARARSKAHERLRELAPLRWRSSKLSVRQAEAGPCGAWRNGAATGHPEDSRLAPC